MQRCSGQQHKSRQGEVLEVSWASPYGLGHQARPVCACECLACMPMHHRGCIRPLDIGPWNTWENPFFLCTLLKQHKGRHNGEPQAAEAACRFRPEVRPA